ncbi:MULTISPECIES: thiamine pyrophosphate-binding protein [Bradyrhizobium]|uniref:Acetolactate synthase-1/2/3 large subunit n=2 Tax=Bradyrhizobium TaxID=374 RepID=A0ABY0PEA4_9BRAD|nr:MULTISPECIES: thiamine pyrophosphate-binding protein [Bradyrhizobium]SDI20456.1 acetolactate synthase-1/2/3 large subunit [Bradyrhizobium ottawaense]SED74252.1 acetolactate synthase-1/2/3 large subunit [Bradyrhizobium lablabi]SHL69906.1 acetolactate synthase-1/2/3 large subunit [Bradyrhizobium lablabi]
MTVERMLSEEEHSTTLIGRVLQEAGIEYVFGISGGHTARIVSSFGKHKNSLRMVLVREESLAAVMAEVYGRLTRRPGVMIGQGPWVLGNGMIGIIEAYLSSSPMLLLTDFSDAPLFHLHAPYQQATGDYGSWDARRAFGAVTKQVMQAHEPVAAVQATQLAIKHAVSGQPGPVAILFAQESLGPVKPDSHPCLYPTRYYLPPAPPPADITRVAAAAKALQAAKRPVIVAGNGVRIAQAYKPLVALAEAAGLPVVTTAAGKGIFAETHPLALGVFGTFGTEAANACVGEADLVLAVGTKLGPSDTAWENRDLLDPTRQTFIQIDIEPRNASWTFPAEHVLVGDAGQVLLQLREAIDSAGRKEAGERRVAKWRKEKGYFDQPGYFAEDAPILPQRIIGEMMRALPDNTIVTCDAGENRIMMTHWYQTKQAGGFLQAAGSGPMGFAIPAALGAKLVHPERTVVAVCGDGGFSMTMNGLMTAIEEDIPIITVVLNNMALGWVLHGHGPVATEFKDFDYAAIARSMGCRGVRVTDPAELASALQEAVSANKPTVIDVQTSLAQSFADITSPLAVAAAPKRR